MSILMNFMMFFCLCWCFRFEGVRVEMLWWLWGWWLSWRCDFCGWFCWWWDSLKLFWFVWVCYGMMYFLILGVCGCGFCVWWGRGVLLCLCGVVGLWFVCDFLDCWDFWCWRVVVWVVELVGVFWVNCGVCYWLGWWGWISVLWYLWCLMFWDCCWFCFWIYGCWGWVWWVIWGMYLLMNFICLFVLCLVWVWSCVCVFSGLCFWCCGFVLGRLFDWVGGSWLIVLWGCEWWWLWDGCCCWLICCFFFRFFCVGRWCRDVVFFFWEGRCWVLVWCYLLLCRWCFFELRFLWLVG